MTDPLDWLNALPPAEAENALLSCCGSRAWAREVARRRPFADRAALHAAADEAWWALGTDDWLEAFRAHPRIGARRAEAPQAGAGDRWSAQEQAGVAGAEAEVRAALAAGNVAYEERFGHVFLIRASGRSAEETLDELRRRLENEPAAELREAAEQQRQITRIQLEKLLEP